MSTRPPATLPPIETPLLWLEDVARPEWTDGNGHMSAVHYAVVFEQAVSALLQRVGLSYRYAEETRRGAFLLDWHITFVREVMEGARLTFPTRIVDMTDKAFHYYIEMRAGEEQYLAAVSEGVELHMDLDARRPVPFAPAIGAWFHAAVEAHKTLGPPEHTGRVVKIKRKGE
ncbi:MAG: thioesterase family protein [Rhodospirillaceae bacterium]|jgi:acyl-CoA thioester hydrolase|nr:thioesterase family protein [Rhodospirillaceae bacterium]MBT6118753.1 thioesterase family protein [Rhodospirillaceae bacterium]